MRTLPLWKPCSKCGETKPLDQFALDKRKKNGRAAACKTCHNAQNRTYVDQFRTCKDCRVRKPIAAFASTGSASRKSFKRICIDCKAHKVCKVCGERLPVAAFDGYHGLLCRACQKDANAQRYRENRDYFRERNAGWRAEHAQPGSPYRERQKRIQQARKIEIKTIVYEHYGGFICACCGETEPIFLTIDHINNDGNQHRKETGNADSVLWLYRNGLPPGFRVLCYNCNAGRWRNGGVCPHEAERERIA